jgi:hypothetical protein
MACFTFSTDASSSIVVTSPMSPTAAIALMTFTIVFPPRVPWQARTGATVRVALEKGYYGLFVASLTARVTLPEILADYHRPSD